MSFHRKPAAALGLSAFLILASAGGASALEAGAFGERLKAWLESQGIEVAWTAISANGDEVTLEGVTAGAPEETGTLELGDVTLQGVTEEDGGAYRIGSFELPAYTYSDEEVEVAVEGFSLSGLTLPAEGATDPMAGLALYENFSVASAVVAVEGAEVATLTNFQVDITPPEDGSALQISGGLESFSADLSKAEDPKAREAIAALGYETLTGSVEMAASWSPTDGRLHLEQTDIIVDDVGTLGISFDIGGYTADFAKAVQDLQTKMQDAPQEQQSAQGLAMLGLMQQLTFNGATIRFDDDSVTGKVLDYTAEQQGMKRADIANLAKAVMPLYLAQLGNQEFSESVTEAVSTFLDNPESIMISAHPAEPAAFAMIFASAMTAPQSLIGQLGVTVTANEAE